MKKPLILLFLILFASFLYAFEKEKATSIYREKVIIADFGEHTSIEGLGKAVSDEIIALFVQTKRFDIIERGRLQQILEEQQMQLSGLINTEDAVRVGKIAGAKYIIFGSVTGADATHSEEEKTVVEKTKSGKVKKDRYILTSWRGTVNLSARLVDIETGVVLLGKTVTGYGNNEEKREAEDKTFLEGIINIVTSKDEDKAKEIYFKQGDQKVIGLAKRDAAVKLVEDFLEEFPLTGYVLSEEEGDYLIDLGTEKGLNAEANLQVIGKSEYVKHPVTGEVIKSRTDSLGYLKVIDLGPGVSKAKFVRGDEDRMKPGDKVQVVDPIFVWHRALASFVFPGMGQFLEKRWGTGIFFLLFEGALLGTSYYFYYRSTDSFLKEQTMFDTEVWDEKTGEQYDTARRQALVGMWIFIAMEAIVHIWDTIDAGYPAERNQSITSYAQDNNTFYAFQDKNENIKIGRTFRF
ncbi:MAG: hypothetical protein JW827_04280 [Spirochaetes bacterium]|nr:hypothetical protein [Spirochaetota bacterium]